MAIQRTAWIDDDGTGTTGTVINNAEKTLLYNQIDAALADPGSVGAMTVVTSATTGTVTSWNPGHVGKGRTLVLWNGASALTVNSLAAGASGQIVTFKATSLGTLFFVNSGGTEGLRNFASSAPTPLATNGAATYQFQTGIGWHLISHDQGDWIQPPFNAADFTADSATWTVEAADIYENIYRVTGRVLSMEMALGATSLSATSTGLHVAIPAGFQCGFKVGYVFHLGWLTDNGVTKAAECWFYPGTKIINVRPLGGAALAPSTNNTTVHLALHVPIQ